MRQTRSRRSKSIVWIGGVVLIIIVALLATFASGQASAAKTVQDAWKSMQLAGQYDFSTTVDQVTYPAPALTNVGKSSTRDVYNITGGIDINRHTMQINLLQNQGSLVNSQDGIEIQVSDGKAVGRQAGGQWQEIKDFSSETFAPGGDAAGFLSAAKNIQPQAVEVLKIAQKDGTVSQVEVQRYTFDLDSDAYAWFMRNQLEAQLRRTGSLPVGVDLQMTDTYRGMVAEGKIWLDHEGLPVRMTIHMKMPTTSTGERVEADIATDYLNISRENVLANQSFPMRLAGMLGIPTTIDGLRQLMIPMLLFVGVFVFGALCLVYSKRKFLNIGVSAFMIIAMLISPLMQSNQVAAFAVEQGKKAEEAKASQEQAQKDASAAAGLAQSAWNANQNPLESAPKSVEPSTPSSGLMSWLASPNAQAAQVDDSPVDSDGDGLTDAFESQFPVTDLNPNNPDTDGDGLKDGVEVRLGLQPGMQDSDADGILDPNEVRSFYYAGKDWYSNPLDNDTDKDGQLDSVECPERSTLAADPANGVCRDTDNDGIPDIFDTDDDGDGVPTIVDEAPYGKMTGTFSQANPFNLSLTNVASNKPVFITYQLRPVNGKHLTYSQNVLDWPSGDTKGQITRISNTTYADVLTASQAAADPRSSMGDLRLVPMAEILLTGTTLPLPLKSTMPIAMNSTVKADFEISAVGNSSSIKLVSAVANPVAVYYGNGTCDNFINPTLAGTLSQGGSAAVPWALGTWADGRHIIAIQTASNPVTYSCVDVEAVAHGNLANQVVDDSVLLNYGVSARQGDDGSVILDAPLLLTYDQTTSNPVAFYVKVPFTNANNGFSGSNQKVNMAWMVNVLSDVCKPVPSGYDEASSGTWCDSTKPDHWYTNRNRIVQTYDDPFILTGLTISEQNGTEMAVIYEDPATDTSAQFDDQLWMLSRGLETTFASGRPDMRIDEIKNRFDSRSNSIIPNGDPRLWGLQRDAFHVDRYSYPTNDDTAQFGINNVQTLFSENFASAAESSYATLLFAREINTRTMQLNDSNMTCSASTCSANFSAIQMMTQAVVNWSPYQKTGTEWKPANVQAYLDYFEASLSGLEEYQTTSDTQEARDEIGGKILLARMYYETMNRGLVAPIVIGGNQIQNTPAVWGDDMLQNSFYGLNKKAQGVTSAVKSTAELILKGIQLVERLKSQGGIKSVKDLFVALKAGIGAKIKSITDLLTTKLRIGLAIAGAVLIGLAVVGIVASAVVMLVCHDSYTGKVAGRIFMTSIGLVTVALAIKSIVEAVQMLRQAASWTSEVSSTARTAGIIGLIVGIVITWGVFIASWALSGAAIFSLAFDNMLAEAIAATITLCLYAALSATVVGAVIVAIIGLIDALITTICAAAGASDLGSDHWVNKYVCIGITGWVTKIIKWMLYSQNYMVDYSNGSRLSLDNMAIDLLHPENGMTSGNKMKISMTASNTITLSDIPVDWMAALYFWEYTDSVAKSSAFNYKIQSTETDIHDSLSRYDDSDRWVSLGGHKFKIDYTAVTDGFAFDMPEAGINRSLKSYVTEGSAVPVQECVDFGRLLFPTYFPIPVCWVRTASASFSMELTNSMVVDVLPSTLDGFYTLADKGHGGFSFAWGQDTTIAFPVFHDADGDGLISTYYGGNDPDDSRFDTDNDGLSDPTEIKLGTDPRNFDTDNDGLTDSQELILGTDPLRADTDGDGLNDGDEVAGWMFTYDFQSDGSPLETMVYSNPLTPDSDLDGLTDLQEKIYGFNPIVPDKSDILEYDLQTIEKDSPQLMLRLDETAGATVYQDSTGNGYDATCLDAACPVSGMDGRYSLAARFDGSDVLTIPSAAKGLNFIGTVGHEVPFTLGAWVNRSGSGTLISKWSDDPNSQHELRLEITSGGNLQLVGASSTVTSTGSIDQGVWTQVAVTFDGTNVAFFINGAASGCQGNCSWSNHPSYATTTVEPALMVGAYAADVTTQTGFFSGLLDEVTVYDRALGADEITARLVEGRYNLNDNFVHPGEEVIYQSLVTNLLNSRFAYGLLTTMFNPKEAVLNWANKLQPARFELYPDNPVVTGVNTARIQDTLTIDPTYDQSGDLTISQTASEQIVDKRTESNRAELWLKLNEDVGASTFVDSSGNMPPRNATCSSCPTSGVSAVLNNAVTFSSGGDTPIQLSTLTTLNLLNRGITVSLWVKPVSTSTANARISLLKSTGNEFVLEAQRNASGNFVPTVKYNGTDLNLSVSRVLVPDNWSHLVVTFNTVGGVLTVYINGAPVGSRSGLSSLSTSSSFFLGGTPQQTAYTVDDLRIFSRPISTSDINRLAERPVLQMNMEAGGFADASIYSQPVSVPILSPTQVGNSIRGSALSAQNQGFVKISGNPLLDLQDGNFTISTWIYPATTSVSTWQGIYGYDSSYNGAGTNTYPTLERSGQMLRFRFGTGSGTYSKQSGSVLAENQWNHVVVTFQQDPTNAAQYLYRLFVNAVQVDSDISSSKPASGSTLFVGHSGYVYRSTVVDVSATSSDDAGSHFEPYLYRYTNGSRETIWPEQSMSSDGDYALLNISTTLSNYQSIEYAMWEADAPGNPDDYCGSGYHYWTSLPGDQNINMSNGFEGTMKIRLERPSTGFRGNIDEMEIYRYGLDSEQVYDLYHSIPITAGLPLDDRPSSDTFENKAVIGVQDDGHCTGTQCPAAGVIGLINQAVRFDGTNDVIDVPVNTTTDYMVSLWVNSICPSCGLYSLQANDTSILNQLYLKSGNVCGLTGTTEVCSSGGTVTDGQWHHVVYSNNGARADLWVDGVIVNTISGGGTLPAAPGATAHLGTAPAAGSADLDGMLDDVRVFRYSQAAEVVAQLLKRSPLFLAHLDDPTSTNGMEDATPADWKLTCTDNADPNLSACPKADMEGRLGRSVEFDGQNDALSLLQSSLSSTATDFSVTVWVMPTRKINQVQTIWTLANPANSAVRYSLAIQPDGMKVCLLNLDPAVTCTGANLSAVDLIKDNWNEITVTVERTPSVENARIYINGYWDSTHTFGNAINTNGLGKLTLGNMTGFQTIGGTYAGRIDEAGVYEYMLNDIDIREAFQYQMATVEESKKITLTIDAENPAVSLVTYNSSFPYQDGNDHILQVDASDTTSGIAMVELMMKRAANETQWQVAPVCLDSVNGNSFCPTFNPTFGEGTYTLTLRSVDKVGHQSDVMTYPIRVDATAPRIVTDQIEGDLLPASPNPTRQHVWNVHLSGKILDDTLSDGTPSSGVDQPSARLSIYSELGQLVGDGTQILALSGNESSGYTWALDYPMPENEPTGKLKVVVEVQDKVGNQAHKVVNILLDATPSAAMLDQGALPTPDLSSPEAMAGSSAILTGGTMTGTVTDTPADTAPYMTTDGKNAASGVQKVQAIFDPLQNASYLFNEPYPAGLLAWLPLDREDFPTDNSGNPDPEAGTRLYLDISPNQTAGTCVMGSCPTTGAFGHRSTETYFDGNGKFINMGKVVNLSERSFSVSIWAKRDQMGRNDPILWQGPVSIPAQRFLFGINADNRFVCGFGGTDLLTVPYQDTDWHAWSCTFDLATGQRAIYRDGQAAAIDIAMPIPAMNENLFIGNSPVGSFMGRLDELMIQDHALDAEGERLQYTGYQTIFQMSVDQDFAVSGDRIADRSGFFQTAILDAGTDKTNKITAGASGKYGLSFTGSEHLTVDPAYSLQLDRGAYTLAAWIKPSGTGAMDIISQRDENPERRYPSLVLTAGNGLRTGFGDGYIVFTVDSPDGVVPPDEWSLVAATFDGQLTRLYVNGQMVFESAALAGVKPYPTQTFNIGEKFNGLLDEIQVYPRALSQLELMALTQSGWKEADLRTGTTGIIWSLGVPEGLEGPFNLDVRGWDQQGHFNTTPQTHNQWGGLIDTLAPRMTVSREVIDPADPFAANFDFVIEDSLLDESFIHQNVCPDPILTREYYNSEWYLASGAAPNTQLFRLSGHCVTDLRTTIETGITACDGAGNCVSQTYPPLLDKRLYLPSIIAVTNNTGPDRKALTEKAKKLAANWPVLQEGGQDDPGEAPLVEILTTRIGKNDLRNPMFTLIKGRASDDGEISAIWVRILKGDVEVVKTQAGLMGDTWNAMWVFPWKAPKPGSYTVEVSATDKAGRTTIVQQTLTVDFSH